MTWFVSLSHLISPNSQENLSGYPSQSDQPNPSDWILDSDGRVFNLAVLGRTNDNALTLRSDFMVSRRVLSSDVFSLVTLTVFAS